MLSAAAGIMLAATFFCWRCCCRALGQADELTANRLPRPRRSSGRAGSPRGRRRIELRNPSLWCRTNTSCSARKDRKPIALPASGCSSSPSRCTTFPRAWPVGVGCCGRRGRQRRRALAVGIGLQNVPEADSRSPCRMITIANYSRIARLWVATLTGLVEPVGGAMGAAKALVSLAEPL